MQNIQLTENFNLYELTQTSAAQFLEMNRTLTDEQVKKLKELAKLLEHVRFVLNAPLTVNSGYRCPELNKTVGSSDRSQHLLCEAADFVPAEIDLGAAFRRLWKDIKENGTNVGQLIYETAARPYGYTSWLHISLGTPYREESRCKQILRMENGIYTRLG